MVFGTITRRFGRRLAALGLLFGAAGPVAAADVAPAPVAAPAAAPALPCATCGGGHAAGAPCNGPAVKKHGVGHMGFHKAPYQTYLCPGACFGYFQTQWHRWEDVCPLPYQGVGLTDAPVPPTGALKQPGPYGPAPGGMPPADMTKPGDKGSELPPPRPSPMGTPMPKPGDTPLPKPDVKPSGKPDGGLPTVPPLPIPPKPGM